ncbi:polyisoprenoid-binding protein, partial [Leucobacter chromiiresistens]
MKQSQKVLIGVGAGVVVLAVAAAIVGPVIYRDLIAGPAADTPSLASEPASPGSPDQTAEGDAAAT